MTEDEDPGTPAEIQPSATLGGRPVRSNSPARDSWRRLIRNRVALVCMLYIAGLVLLAVAAPLVAHYRYDTQDYSALLSPPGGRHPLGTDNLGEDVLSRLVYGARVSLGVALVVITIEISIGLPLGLVAGYRGGATDLVLMRVTDAMFAFPDILLAILLQAIIMSGNTALPPAFNFLTLFAALGIVAWPGMARLVRGQAMALRDREFVDAARAAGVRPGAIIWRHIAPNLMGPVIVQITQDVANVVLAEATLSFLGLGVQPPFPSWGRMINDALPYKEAHPLLLMFPSLALALTVMAFNFLGDAMRDALDPRLRE